MEEFEIVGVTTSELIAILEAESDKFSLSLEQANWEDGDYASRD